MGNTTQNLAKIDGHDVLRAGVIALAIYFVGSVLLAGLGAPTAEDDAISENLLLGSMLLNFLAFFGTVYWMIVRFRGLSWHDLGFRPIAPRWIMFSIGIAFLTIIFLEIVTPPINRLVGIEETNRQMEQLARFDFTLLGGITLLIYGAGLVPLAEETFFRGVLFAWLRDRAGFVPGAIVSAVVFALMHGMAAIFVPIVILGLVLAFLYEHTGSLWPAIIVHQTNNALTLISVFVLQSYGGS